MEIFLGIVLVIFVWSFIAKGIIIVKQAEIIIIERFGKFEKIITSGLNFIIPIVDSPRVIMWKYPRTTNSGKVVYYTATNKRIDLRESVYDFPKQNVITSDNVTIEINALLYFQILDPQKSVYEISNLPEAIEKLTQTTLRNVLGELTLDETLTSRDTINSKLRAILDDATDKWGVKVNRVELQDVIPPVEIRTAMEKQMKAERDKRALILKAEGDKKSAILNAEGLREARVLEARGLKESRVLEAEGQAEARFKIAEAEGLALNKIKESIESTNPNDPANYLIALKYVEALKNISNNAKDKVVFMPFEASSLLGSIGGIKELLKK